MSNDIQQKFKNTQSAPAGGPHEKTMPILAFLRALESDQSVLLPIFLSMGVADEAALQDLVRMRTRDAWLYSWVQRNLITELQFHVLISGFRAMHSIAPMSSQ